MTYGRAAKLPRGRTLAEFYPLRPAEEKLLRHTAEGTLAVLGHERPSKGSSETTVRAAFIRFLALGGDGTAPVHEKGIRLRGAWIIGVLDLANVETKGSLGLDKSNLAQTPVLRDAHIKGFLQFTGSKMPGLKGDRLTCDGSLFFKAQSLATGEFRLVGAKIAGNLDFGGSTLRNRGEIALRASRIAVGGDVFLTRGFKAIGEVRLLAAKIGGSLFCGRGTFWNENNIAIDADNAEVGGDVCLWQRFKASGEVRLLAAKIRGNLECSRGTFQNEKSTALYADNVDVGGDVFLRGGFNATGEVRLLAAKIRGNLECSRGTFQNQSGSALSADNIEVEGDVVMDDRFKAGGFVDMPGAKIGGDLKFQNGRFSGAGAAINLRALRTIGALVMKEITIETGGIDLAGARVSTLQDDEDSWPKSVNLDGFVYGSLPGYAPFRIGWLDRQMVFDSRHGGDVSEFRPQPWQQLRKVLREMGHYEAAREVGIAFEDRKRRCEVVGGRPENPVSEAEAEWSVIYSAVVRALHWLYGLLVDYGYRPLKLAGPALLVWVFCALFFEMAAWNGGFAPTSAVISAQGEYVRCMQRPFVTPAKCVPPDYPQFYPVVYSLNVLLPVGDLGQEAAWQPKNATWAGWLIQFVVWFETLFGWVASLILVAVGSGLVKHDE